MNDRVQEVVDLADALEGLDGIERVEPFTCFCGIAILVQPLLLFPACVYCGKVTKVVVPMGNDSSFNQPERRTLFPAVKSRRAESFFDPN